jgi:hypothetical protein
VSFDPIESLRVAGVPVEVLSEEQCSALASLTESEVGILRAIRSRLNAAAGDMEGQHSFNIALWDDGPTRTRVSRPPFTRYSNRSK